MLAVRAAADNERSRFGLGETFSESKQTEVAVSNTISRNLVKTVSQQGVAPNFLPVASVEPVHPLEQAGLVFG